MLHAILARRSALAAPRAALHAHRGPPVVPGAALRTGCGRSASRRPGSTRLTGPLRAIVSACAILALLACGPGAAAGQRPAHVYGLVVDAGSGKPVAGAVITVEGPGTAIEASDRGRFELPALPAGRYSITVERIGYETRREVLDVPGGSAVDVVIRLSTRPIRLNLIEVTARSGKLAEAGYYERRDEGGIRGHFITHADLIHRNAQGLTDALYEVPGVRVHYLEPGRTTVRFNRHVPQKDEYAFYPRNPIPGCEPDLYIDGRLYLNSSPPMNTSGTIGFKPSINRVDDFNAVPVSQIEGVEVYVGAAVPPFVYNTACGVILIWTRR